MENKKKLFGWAHILKDTLGLILLTLIFSGFTAKKDIEKVTICHIPPGNHFNCHEITISLDALEAHMNHGDKIICSRPDDYPDILDLVHGNKEKILVTYE